MRFSKEFTKAVRKWLKANGFTTSCRLDKDWVYDPNINSILIPREYDDAIDFDFIKFLRKHGLVEDFDCITLSILHELGHAETMHLFTEDEWFLDMLEKINNTPQYAYSEKELTKINFNYWEKSKVEFSANNWLIMYVKTFPEKVAKLEEIVDTFYN